MLQALDSFCLPSFEFQDSSREKPGDDFGKLHFDEFCLAELLHFSGSFEVAGEPAVVITVTAIHRRFGAVRFRTAALRIVLERHRTTLADFVLHGLHGEIGVGDGEIERPAL